MRPRLVLAWLTAATLVVAIGACSLLPSYSPDRSTPSAERVDPALAEYYGQVLSWRECGEQLQCSTVSAPLDWQNPAAPIELSVVRHKATGDRIGSLLVNPGGPGGSGFDFVHDSLDYAVGEPLQERFDIIGFDPRGVARSTPVRCLDAAGMDELLYTDAVGEPGSDEFIDEQLSLSAEFYAACRKNTGALFDHVDTVSAARDLDLLRAVLGDRRLHYLGYSYGTLLGATYAELYPDKVGAMVLDGAIDPSASDTEATINQAAGFESAFDAFAADCLGGPDCPLTGSPEQAKQQVREMLADVHRNPIPAENGRELNEAVLSTAIFQALYSSEYWALLSEVFRQVSRGETEEAFRLADFYNGRQEDGSYRDNSTEAFIAISCLDRHGPLDRAMMAAEASRLAEAAPLLGVYFSYGQTLCSVFDGPERGLNRAVHAAGSEPILVVGTSNDPATPYQQAVALAEQLDNGHLVTYNGEGHTAYRKSNECVDRAVENYLLHGMLPQGDPNC